MKKQITKILLLAFLCLSMAFTAKAQSTIFYEDFESTSVGQIPTGWTQEIYSGTLLWEVVDEGYPNFNSVCFNTSGTYTNSDTELITPVIDFTGYRNATLSFYLKIPAWGDDINELNVDYRSSGGTVTRLFSSDGYAFETYGHIIRDLPEDLEGSGKIVFEGLDNFGFPIWIDDVTVTGSQVGTYDLWVAGVQVSEDNANDILGNGTASFIQSTNTLNLNGVNIAQGYSAGGDLSTDYAGIRSKMEISTLNINLQGENNITVKNADARLAEAFEINHADIVFSGSGSITIDATNFGIVSPWHSVTINDGTFIINSDSSQCIIASYNNIYLNGGDITCYSGYAAMQVEFGSIIIDPSLTIYEGDEAPGTQVSQLSGNPTMNYVHVSSETGTTTYDLWVAGVQVSEDNVADILGNGTASFNPSTNTLNLNGVNITQGYNAGSSSGTDYAGIRSNMQISTLNINLQGENNITINKPDGDFLIGVYHFNGNIVTFSGNGSLNIDVQGNNYDEYGIYGGNCIIQGGAININSSYSGIGCNDLDVDGGEITCFGDFGPAIGAFVEITIADGMLIYEGDEAPGTQVSQLSGNPTMRYVKITNIVGIDENAVSNISVYPNPASSLVYIEGAADNTPVTVYDITGKVVMTALINSADSGTSLNITRLQPGMYFIRGENINSKFIKQ